MPAVESYRARSALGYCWFPRQSRPYPSTANHGKIRRGPLGNLIRFLCLVIESKAFQYPRRMLRYAGCSSDRLLGSAEMQQVPLLPAWG